MEVAEERMGSKDVEKKNREKPFKECCYKGTVAGVGVGPRRVF